MASVYARVRSVMLEAFAVMFSGHFLAVSFAIKTLHEQHSQVYIYLGTLYPLSCLCFFKTHFLMGYYTNVCFYFWFHKCYCWKMFEAFFK